MEATRLMRITMRSFQRAARRTGRRSRRGRSRGQALVEFALLVPLLMFMLVGATDVASLLDDHLNIIYAIRTSARVGATLGTAPQADCAIIGALRATLSGVRNLQIQQIIIFKSNGSGAPITASEDGYAGTAVCNSDGTISPAATALNWPPGARSTTPFTEDSLGVEVDYTYTFQLNLLGIGQFSAQERAVMPLEVVIGAPVPPSGVGQ
jgi:Flp pilus assembly protein TadG